MEIWSNATGPSIFPEKDIVALPWKSHLGEGWRDYKHLIYITAGNMIWRGWSWKTQSRWFRIDGGFELQFLKFTIQFITASQIMFYVGGVITLTATRYHLTHFLDIRRGVGNPATIHLQRGNFFQGFAGRTNPCIHSSIHPFVHPYTVQPIVVCIYTYLYIYICIYIYTYTMYSNLYLYRYICDWTCICALWMLAGIHAYTYTHIPTSTHTYIYI